MARKQVKGQRMMPPEEEKKRTVCIELSEDVYKELSAAATNRSMSLAGAGARARYRGVPEESSCARNRCCRRDYQRGRQSYVPMGRASEFMQRPVKSKPEKGRGK